MEIRATTQEDLPRLFALYEQYGSNDQPPSPQDANQILDKLSQFAGSAIFIGLVDDNIVTSCTLVVVPNLTRSGRPYALIENVITDANYRTLGYGHAILKHATSAAWSHGCYKVMLLAGSKSPALLRFYEGSGFEQSKTGFQIRRP